MNLLAVPLVAAAVLLLAGCLPAGLQAADPAAGPSGRAQAGVRLAGGAVAIVGPQGYCVDPVGTRDGPRGAFALLGSCAALNGEGQPPARRAALTATISPAGEGASVADSLPALLAFFNGDTGRALLSRSGDPDTVAVVSSDARDGALYLKLRDTSPFDGAEMAEDYWRVLFDVGPRVVTLSVIPFRATPLSDAAAEALLEEFRARVLQSNPAPPPPPDPDASLPPPAEPPPAAVLAAVPA